MISNIPLYRTLLAIGLSTSVIAACGNKEAARGGATTPAVDAIAAGQATCAPQSISIYFDEWKSELSEEAKSELVMFQQRYAECTINSVMIAGLAGAPGDEAANLAVSEERAAVIADFLASGGWPREVFEMSALGNAGATRDGVAIPLRRRADIAVTASPR